ncbi:hypothetical protein CFAM422_001382 [Trichoderma lentiforme]|uniref:Uncharacterized protein n=1 Tax=Trichoderma lentiforme TaxID=1567552 RepID=A0A9P4XNM8_9HYPO|nr:hypothetical protein CFAM422_001382 [Trichoderma lentiforme]
MFVCHLFPPSQLFSGPLAPLQSPQRIVSLCWGRLDVGVPCFQKPMQKLQRYQCGVQNRNWRVGGGWIPKMTRAATFVIEFCEAKATRCGFEGSEFSHPRGLGHLQKTPGANGVLQGPLKAR